MFIVMWYHCCCRFYHRTIRSNERRLIHLIWKPIQTVEKIMLLKNCTKCVLFMDQECDNLDFFVDFSKENRCNTRSLIVVKV